MVQPALHPSLGTVLPSSQASLDALNPSPQLLTQTLGSELSQVKPHSTEQLDEHPSPLSVSPSSHVSPPRVFPSPQISLPVGHVVHVD
jgi:hypothetical protein